MKNPKMSNKQSEVTSKRMRLDSNGCDSAENELDSSGSFSTPTKSRFGRSHKPKVLGDFLSTDKKVSALLKVNPGNQIKYFMESGRAKSPKKEKSPKKSPIKMSPKTVKRPLYMQPPVLPQEIKVEANELEPVPGCEWMVGDLAWARVGNHPFWPCIINIDPTLGIFTRIRMFSRSLVPLRRLHVQFFGDNGRRSWLSSSAVMNYTGKEAFDRLAKSILSGMKRKDPRQMSALVVKPQMRNVWEAAVCEAESLLNATREERVLHFRKLYPALTIPVNHITSTENENEENDPNVNEMSSTSVLKKRGRKRKAETSADPHFTSKQIKLEESENELQETYDDQNNELTKSGKKLSILERVRLSQKRGDSEESRSPSLRLKKKKEEEEVRKKVEDEKKKQEAIQKRIDAKVAEKEESKSDGATPELRRTRGVSAQEVLKDELEKEKQKVKKKKRKVYGKFGADFKVFSSKHFDRVLDEHSELNEKEVEKYLEKMWLDMDEQQKSRYRPRINTDPALDKGSEDESEECRSSENDDEDAISEERTSNSSEKSSSPSPLAMATSKAGIGKRGWGLFNRALPSKVCQICEKPGDTLRCKGPCSGTYHLECALNPIEMSARRQELQNDLKSKVNRKKKDKKGRKKSGNVLEDSKSDSVSKDLDKTVDEGDISTENLEADEKMDDDIENSKVTSENKNNEVVKDEKEISDSCNDDLPDAVPDEKVDTKVEKGSETDETNEEKVNGQDDKPKAKKSRGKGSKESNDSGEDADGQGEFRCPDCSEGRVQPCFFCGLEEKNGDNKRIRCHIAHCGKVYHAECLKAWPQTSWTSGGKRGSQIKADVMTCPQHSCHTCVSDNPAVMKARFQNDKLVRCLRCPTSYHYGNHCLPAGSEVLTSRQIICPKHYRPLKKGTHHVNAAWCFICATGGSLICCDLCPTAFHADCLKISPPEGGYICEDCETGRFPLYGEVVWVKLGSYRWWPAQILFPYQIPENIQNLAHTRGEFAVRFFGSHDYYWVNRGRVFLYQEGDSGKGSSKHSQTDQVFLRAVQEASEAYLKVKNEKSLREAETRPGLKPPYYIKIKTNKPVGAVRMIEANVSSMTPCECDPNSSNPCAPDSDCLNRILMVECNPLICPAGDRCKNQLFEKRQYPPLMPYRTEGRGWGLKTIVDLKKGDFVIEYVGEMIDEEEYQRRLKKMHQANDENYYFLTIDKDRMLDAGPKGNVARFMNHSCQPNCETQKWTVNGDTRVGLFALCDIPAHSELVFNYNLESIGTDKKPCMCGAPNCSGFIGVKASKNTNGEEEKKTVQVKKGVNKKVKLNKTSSSDDVCFMCGEGGELLLCDSKACPKGYHLSCLKRTKWPQGKWLCPWHQCNVCSKGRVKRCTYCVNSYCPNHVDGNIRLDDILGLVCSKHDDKVDSKMNMNDSKKSETEQLGVEVDPNMEVDEVSNCEDQSELDNVLTNENIPVSASSPVPPFVTSDVVDVSNKDHVEDNGSCVEENEVKEKDEVKESFTTQLEELTDLTVTKPTREYRNKRLKSNSDAVNGITRSVSTTRRQRPVSVDSLVMLGPDNRNFTNVSLTDTEVNREAVKNSVEEKKVKQNQESNVLINEVKELNEDVNMCEGEKLVKNNSVNEVLLDKNKKMAENSGKNYASKEVIEQNKLSDHCPLPKNNFSSEIKESVDVGINKSVASVESEVSVVERKEAVADKIENETETIQGDIELENVPCVESDETSVVTDTQQGVDSSEKTEDCENVSGGTQVEESTEISNDYGSVIEKLKDDKMPITVDHENLIASSEDTLLNFNSNKKFSQVVVPQSTDNAEKVEVNSEENDDTVTATKDDVSVRPECDKNENTTEKIQDEDVLPDNSEMSDSDLNQENLTVECSKIDLVVNNSNILQTEQSAMTESDDSTVTKDIVNCEKDNDLLVNGSCTVNASPPVAV
ncbi:nuclear receptor binding SET domain protein isoform X2 [Lycorma delicatula]|uniref:nuclear receptor binding SET domain protein isoform X2 n=1 Tax=Lycorma delicatula TaxID=130591 RepID=UPI003F512DE5